MAVPVLWVLDRLQSLLRALGADYAQLRAIVQVKLLMDSRRAPVMLGRYGREASENNNTFARTLLMYGVIGGLLSLTLLLAPARDGLFLLLSLQFSYVMMICAMTLISDFSSVILDSSDNQIILPRPVGSRTLWLARVVHIASYLSAIVLSLSAVAVLVVGYRFGGLAGLFYLVLALLSGLLMVFVTNVLYLLLMRFISEEKLREVINYFQIFIAILFYGGYQILPRMLGRGVFSAAILTHQWWHFLIPPMWMAGAAEMIIIPTFDQTHLLFLLLALIMPFAGLWLMSRFLTTNFTQKLSGIDQVAQPVSTATTQHISTGWLDQISGWFTNNPLERAAFSLTWRVTGRDRKFKLKTYPQLGFGLAYLIAMSLPGQPLSRSGSEGSFYLFALYFAGLYVGTAQYQLGVSDNYRASWIYGSTSIQQPGNILVGAQKALIVKLLTPFYLLVSLYILYRYGIDKISDTLLGYCNSLVLMMSTALLQNRSMPFSAAPDAQRQNNTARNLIILVVIALIGFLHFGLTLIPYGVPVAIPVSAAIFWYLLNQYRQTRWDQIVME